QQVQLAALLLHVQRGVFDELHQFVHIGVFSVDVGSLVNAGQEGRLPVFGPAGGHAFGAHGDVAGQVFIFRAQAVGDPGAKAGAVQAAVARVHETQGGLMVGHIGLHGADDAEVIGKLGGAGKDV